MSIYAIIKDYINSILQGVLNNFISSPFSFFFFLVLLHTSWEIIIESTEDFSIHLPLVIFIVSPPHNDRNHTLKKMLFSLTNSADSPHFALNNITVSLQ